MLDHVVIPTSVKIQIELTQLPNLARLLASVDSGHQIRIQQQQWKLLREAIPLEGWLPQYTKNMSFIAILCILMIWMYFWNDKKGRRQPKQISGTGHGDRGPRKSDSYF